MLKTLAAGSFAVALIASVASAAFAADEGSDRRYHQSQVTRCETLMHQFDAAGTKNSEALALRDRAGKNCEDAAKYSAADGIAELEKALRIINIKPM